MMADWGFNFARLPMSYWTWGDVNDRSKIDEATLRDIDQAIGYGEKHGILVNLNFHRAPGYCINRGELEPYQLFEDEEAQEATCFHWRTFAERYRGILNHQLSFGVLDSGRSDVDYEDYRGHRLDRKMLTLLQKHLVT